MIVGGLIGFSPASAQTYPSKPIRIINPYPAGGGMDYLIRPIFRKMSENLKGTNFEGTVHKRRYAPLVPGLSS